LIETINAKNEELDTLRDTMLSEQRKLHEVISITISQAPS